MKNVILIVIFTTILSACNFSESNNDSNEIKGEYSLIWSDEFDYSGLPNPEKWGYDTEGNEYGWGNNEAQYYTDADLDNAVVENGILSITAHRENFEGKAFTSARLISLADWKYGKIEVNAKLPDAIGTWSAIWLMPGGWSFSDGNWPDVGEIDIMEHVGHDLGIVHASAHSKDYQWQKNTQKTATTFIPDVSEKFHSYIIDWSPDVIKAYVDNRLYFEYKNEEFGESKWPYNKPFYLILNLAVGGAWGSLNGIDTTAFPQTMEIDYVRVYQKKHQPNKQ